MLLNRINIEQKLRNVATSDISGLVDTITTAQDLKEDRIRQTLFNDGTSDHNTFNFDLLDTNNIFHLSQIEKVCIDYRLRFLDTKYFKAKIPYEAMMKIKELEKTHNLEMKGFKIMAPSKLFKLENPDDPLLFAPMGNDYFYLIHKWGNDLHPLRKLLMWPYKNFSNLMCCMLLISLLLTYLMPSGLFSKNEENLTEFVLMFLFMFKWVVAVVLYYAFAQGKNFNYLIWDSKYI